MEQNEILEGNKLIADSPFSGLIYDQRTGMYEDDKNAYGLMSLQYHTSWDWIMPVVEKIIKTPWNKEGAWSVCSDVMEALSYAELETVFVSVVKFIKWYNQNNKQ